MAYTHIFLAFTSHLEVIVIHGGYFFLFLTTLLEGIPLIGMLVPGHISIIIAGFLGSVGILNIYKVIVISIFGAILGDFMGFYLGRKYGMPFIEKFRPYFFISEAHIAKARSLLSRHTGKALIIGRFSPVTRALMPFLVGTTKASAGRFWFFNFLGGLSWVISSILIGYIFGASYYAVTDYLGSFTVFAIITSIIIIWGYYFVNSRFHIFKKYELFALILNLASLYFLTKTIQDAWATHSFMANFDVYVSAAVTAFDNLHQFTVMLFIWITNIGSVTVVTIVGSLCVIILATKGRWRSAVMMLSSLGLTLFSLGVLKEFFLRERPVGALINLVDPSFPSGHAAMAAAFFTIVGYLSAIKIKSTIKRELVIAICVLAALVIGVSRIMLNVHWFSDVVAGWALGVFFATASILMIRYLGALFVKNK